MSAIGTWAEHIPCSMSSSKDSSRPPAELETRVCEMCFSETRFETTPLSLSTHDKKF